MTDAELLTKTEEVFRDLQKLLEALRRRGHDVELATIPRRRGTSDYDMLSITRRIR